MRLRKLGCRPARRRARQPMLTAMRGFVARRAPACLIRDSIDPAPLMLGNDVLAACRVGHFAADNAEADPAYAA
ncbi:hypothetical protein B0W47_08420 [Komagataeibacter nataicola]|uniref:Uncharacterized protein n=1 Tax=Komagataeibacter nataicola TaxID=265960 RepID=A0A9N7CY12_9PROT|nr:hypothetical protein [Komagataeibacter nataicola]AQU87496.1 hypothetical protein B0W47_08420 [Komagataeibacter nataicola]PYD65449.1 hypothetical protein CDI09_13640 [Komagataeibacter nataicola]WNM10226.1 hypothetical protein RI056_08515 [Komagataeibacter nataicola]